MGGSNSNTTDLVTLKDYILKYKDLGSYQELLIGGISFCRIQSVQELYNVSPESLSISSIENLLLSRLSLSAFKHKLKTAMILPRQILSESYKALAEKSRYEPKTSHVRIEVIDDNIEVLIDSTGLIYQYYDNNVRIEAEAYLRIVEDPKENSHLLFKPLDLILFINKKKWSEYINKQKDNNRNKLFRIKLLPDSVIILFRTYETVGRHYFPPDMINNKMMTNECIPKKIKRYTGNIKDETFIPVSDGSSLRLVEKDPSMVRSESEQHHINNTVFINAIYVKTNTCNPNLMVDEKEFSSKGTGFFVGNEIFTAGHVIHKHIEICNPTVDDSKKWISHGRNKQSDYKLDEVQIFRGVHRDEEHVFVIQNKNNEIDQCIKTIESPYPWSKMPEEESVCIMEDDIGIITLSPNNPIIPNKTFHFKPKCDLSTIVHELMDSVRVMCKRLCRYCCDGCCYSNIDPFACYQSVVGMGYPGYSINKSPEHQLLETKAAVLLNMAVEDSAKHPCLRILCDTKTFGGLSGMGWKVESGDYIDSIHTGRYYALRDEKPEVYARAVKYKHRLIHRHCPLYELLKKFVKSFKDCLLICRSWISKAAYYILSQCCLICASIKDGLLICRSSISAAMQRSKKWVIKQCETLRSYLLIALYYILSQCRFICLVLCSSTTGTTVKYISSQCASIKYRFSWNGLLALLALFCTIAYILLLFTFIKKYG